MRLKVFLTGRVSVESDDVVIDEARFPGRQGRLLFAYLVAEEGRPVPRDELADALWGEKPPATSDKALAVLASKLRGLLSEQGIDGGNALTGAFGCYRLELPEGSWVDVTVASNTAQEAEEALATGDAERAKAAAALVLNLTRQPFLPGEEGSWVAEKRREFADVRMRALSALADACLRSGEAPEAAHWAEQSIALEPFRETGYRRLMDAYVAAGNRAEALRVYERCRQLLAEELGTYPSPETESIYRELLEGPPPAKGTPSTEPAMPPRPADLAPEPGSAPARRFRSRKRIGAAAVAAALTAAAIASVLATRGRATHTTAIAADAVGLVGARGDRVSNEVPIGQAPTAVAVGDGAVWTANATAGTVSRVDPRTHTTLTIPVGASPSGIAVGDDGVWVANHDDNTVSWINPQSNTVVENIPVGAGPTAVAYGYGSVWVTNADDRTVTRIDAASGHVVEKAIPTRAVGAGIAVGGGSVWVTNEATRTVYGIDPGTNKVTPKATVGAGPTGIAYGDGSLFVANTLDDTVSCIDGSTLIERARIPVPGGPSAVTVSNGVAWVGAEFGSRLVRIDPRRCAKVGSTPIASRPEGLAPGQGGVWVAARASGKGHQGGRLVVLSSVDGEGAPNSIDPAPGPVFSVSGSDPSYETLTSLRDVGGSAGTQIVPNLAAALPQPTDGGRSDTFQLRPGIRYSDGRLLHAIDFRRALARALELNLGPNSQNIMQPFKHLAGAAGCIHHRRCDLSRSVVVSGPSTVTFRLPAPDPIFLYELAALVPVPAGTPLHDVGTRPVPTTGPYKIERYVPGKLLTLVRNPYFHVWDAAARPVGYPDEIVFRGATSEDAALRDVLAGKADLTTATEQTALFQDVAARHPLQVHNPVPEKTTQLMFLNVLRPPFDDVRVRRALNYAVDRKRVAALRGSAFARPTCQLVPPTVSGYRPYCPYTAAPDASGDWKAPDLAKARALVRASGTRGQTVVVWSDAYFRPEMGYIVPLLRRLGYRARSHYSPDFDHYAATVDKTPGVQAGFMFWVVGAAADILGVVECHLKQNPAHFCNRRIDAQVARLTKQEPTDPAGTAAFAATIDREITNKAPWVPLFTPRIVDVTSARVGNYENSSGYVLLDQLWVR